MLDNNTLASDWIRKAEADALSAAALLETRKGAAETVCFLSQQMAEKCLKAFLVARNREFPKIHQLDLLLALCMAVNQEIEQFRTEALALNDYYIETRYPGDFPEFTWLDAEKAFQDASKIKEFVNSRLR